MGRSSTGIDNTMATYGRFILFRRGTPPLMKPMEIDTPLGGGTTIVVIWSRLDPESVGVLAELVGYRERLTARGIEILTITRESPSDRTTHYLVAEGIDLPVYFDRRGEATVALKSFALPDLLILDAEGRIRFQPEGVEEAVRATLTVVQG